MMKCPGCDLELPEDNLVEQSQHMQAQHPEIVDQRRRAAGFIQGPEGRWHDLRA